MKKSIRLHGTSNVLLITLDSCRFDTFKRSYVPNLKNISPLHKAIAPSYFTYGSHASIWMGFTPGISNSTQPWLNPKAGKLIRMANAGFIGNEEDAIHLEGANIVEGFKKIGFLTIGSGSVGWFDPNTDTGAVLGKPFDRFYYPGNTWSLKSQLSWINTQLEELDNGQPSFVFLNVGETHVPYWHEGADWPREPSPCVPFGGGQCSRFKSKKQQKGCLEWVDTQLYDLLNLFSDQTIIVCADHGDCWGEDGLWEHGISHWATLTVPLLMKVKGNPILKTTK